MSDLPPSVPDSPAVDYVTVFEGARPRLVGLAYRITGSLVDAEDVVSEVWLRWADADHDAVDRPQAWLTTVTARRAIDWARAAARRRETYLGPWLPEPMVTTWPSAADPEAAAELAESLSFGFLTVLDRLDPVARAVADLLGPGEPTEVHVGESRLRRLGEGRFLLRRAGLHIHDELLSKEIPPELAVQTEALIFPSVHRSETNRPSLTVHPLGNLGDAAEVGGLPRELSPVPARLMTSAFLRWHESGTRLGIETTFEATHHGPKLALPSFFIEVGSTPKEWSLPGPVRELASLLRELEVDPLLPEKVCLGVGGGHYMPRFRDLVRERRLAVGHLVPSHHLRGIDRSMAEQLVARTPGVEGVLFARAEEAKGSPLLELLPEVREKDLLPRTAGATAN